MRLLNFFRDAVNGTGGHFDGLPRFCAETGPPVLQTRGGAPLPLPDATQWEQQQWELGCTVPLVLSPGDVATFTKNYLIS